MNQTFEAAVTQFMSPDGEKRSVVTDLSIACQDAYESMVRHSCRLEAEVLLSTGEVSVTVSDDEKDLDFSVTPNGPEVQRGMVAMLNRRAWITDNETL